MSRSRSLGRGDFAGLLSSFRRGSRGRDSSESDEEEEKSKFTKNKVTADSERKIIQELREKVDRLIQKEDEVGNVKGLVLPNMDKIRYGVVIRPEKLKLLSALTGKMRVDSKSSIEEHLSLVNLLISGVDMYSAEYISALVCGMEPEVRNRLVMLGDIYSMQVVKFIKAITLVLGRQRSNIAAQNEFYGFTPKNSSLTDMLTDIENLGNRANKSQEEKIEKFLDVVQKPLGIIIRAKMEAFHARYGASSPTFLNILEWVGPEVLELTGKEKGEREKVKLIKPACTYCKMNNHTVENCRKRREWCSLCGGVHLPHMCSLYKNIMPIQTECMTCRGIYNRDLYHPAKSCIFRKGGN